ncbi:MAG TPA: pseudouridine synthase, partial [Thermoanaerobaculia bacterium]|nr:pseudouridine synthase [Thermoanaerobaculia bacterium]
YRKALVPVGRLDFQTEGLLLLTDDGDFAQRVAHPRYGCTKVYEVKVKDRPAPEALAKLRTRGAVIEGRRVVPVRIEPLQVPGPRGGKNTWWSVEVAEGRTREVREMFFRIGHPVQRLRRVAVGPLRDPSLKPGAVRERTDGEVKALRQATRGMRQGGRRAGDKGGGV